MNAIQKIEALLALREKATPNWRVERQLTGWPVIRSDKADPFDVDTSFPDIHATQNGVRVKSGLQLHPYGPKECATANAEFACAAANATEALRKLLAVAKALANHDWGTPPADNPLLCDAYDAALQAAKEAKS